MHGVTAAIFDAHLRYRADEYQTVHRKQLERLGKIRGMKGAEIDLVQHDIAILWRKLVNHLRGIPHALDIAVGAHEAWYARMGRRIGQLDPGQLAGEGLIQGVGNVSREYHRLAVAAKRRNESADRRYGFARGCNLHRRMPAHEIVLHVHDHEGRVFKRSQHAVSPYGRPGLYLSG